jgi:serine/threonine protein phosphatase PrpC
MSSTASACSACAAPLLSGDAFCEQCGQPIDQLEPTVPHASGPTSQATGSDGAVTSVIANPSAVASGRCRACGGRVGSDGYCSECGVAAPRERDHFAESPAPWIGGVCDRGIEHHRNEDAMALSATADGAWCALVVCDGVSAAPESDRASLAAARSAAALLTTARSALTAAGQVSAVTAASVASRWAPVLVEAAERAQREVTAVARSLGDPVEPPSCTFVAVVVERDQQRGGVGAAAVAWCGDSRAYWLPDQGDPVALSKDHSLGQMLVDSGVSPDTAAKDPGFHTITRWLGADSLDPRTDASAVSLDQSGWLVVCSDGLWNYADSPVQLDQQVRRAVDATAQGVADVPLAVAGLLVDWANAQGGHDNVTAVVARIDIATSGVPL